ncbi:hypothetical protein PGTUg99_027605 [Puccinia graminis f. sp. tritici]|uniref:Uncharacterized protein n=1 Tax=Puccinia graminis f. sp. tritici TaxID=56615 RepID=A0A5B0RKJ0_PUCGR|nr:hypothetical protein PGTUg99_027605 [Puccinia graminis f. sp. tritici]
MEMSNIVFRDADTSETTFPEGYPDLEPVPSPPTGQDDPSSENLEEVNHNILFGITPLPTLVDVPMTDQTPQSPNEIDTICNDLQAKLELDPEHLKIATIAAKVCGYFSSINHHCFLRPPPFSESFDPDCFLSHQYPPNAGAEHASSFFAMGAFNQLSATRSLAAVANHSYDSTFREFVRMRTRMILLIPNLEAYSNNPHKHGVLARTLFYLVLVGCLGLPSFSVTDHQSFTPLQDAVDKQPNNWKEDHLDPAQLQPNSEEGLKHYRTTIGDLIKYQRSHLRELASLI